MSRNRSSAPVINVAAIFIFRISFSIGTFRKVTALLGSKSKWKHASVSGNMHSPIVSFAEFIVLRKESISFFFSTASVISASYYILLSGRDPSPLSAETIFTIVPAALTLGIT